MLGTKPEPALGTEVQDNHPCAGTALTLTGYTRGHPPHTVLPAATDPSLAPSVAPRKRCESRGFPREACARTRGRRTPRRRPRRSRASPTSTAAGLTPAAHRTQQTPGLKDKRPLLLRPEPGPPRLCFHTPRSPRGGHPHLLRGTGTHTSNHGCCPRWGSRAITPSLPSPLRVLLLLPLTPCTVCTPNDSQDDSETLVRPPRRSAPAAPTSRSTGPRARLTARTAPSSGPAPP